MIINWQLSAKGKINVHSNYEYPDKNDVITSVFIDSIEPYKGYWADSENLILSHVEKIMKEPNRELRILDAGCGEGRLIPFLSRYSYELAAVEPDIERYNAAVENVKEKSINNVILKNCTINDIDDSERFDVIFCSHIIQHVDEHLVDEIMSKFHNILNDSGSVFLMTCHSRRKYDCYAKSLVINGAASESPVLKDEFNKVVYGQNILPVHFFSLKNLAGISEKAGFNVQDIRVYHVNSILLKIFKTVKVDALMNKFRFIQRKYGRDVLISLKKENPNG